jgi:putative glutamine amidotransferase
VHDPSLPQDHARDATTLPLIRAALERGIPMLAICRGFQEMNVALGGSLHQAVQEVPGLMDHRDHEGDSLQDKYGPAHRVRIMNGGLLGNVLHGAREITVNSLHGQGLDRLAHGIAIEGVATDGLVEAFSLPAVPFALAVQWHPEWQAQANPDSMKLFGAFGAACRTYQARRGGGA